MTKILGVRCQVSGGKAVTTKNYMDVEVRGQDLEVGSQKRGLLLWERLSSRDLTISTIRTSLSTYRLLELGCKMRFQILCFFPDT
jgi:hypothetical protein